MKTFRILVILFVFAYLNIILHLCGNVYAIDSLNDQNQNPLQKLYALSPFLQPLPNYDICISGVVIDGDTLKAHCLFRGDVTIRLLDVDTFETRRIKHAYRQAKELKITIDDVLTLGEQEKKFVKNLLPTNTPFVLALGERRYGYYNRILGYVLFIKDNQWYCLNDVVNEYHIKLKHNIYNK